MIKRTAESIELAKSVGERIREARRVRGMSQMKLAEKTSISLPHVGSIEKGKSLITIATLKKISEALDVTTDSLLRPNITDRQYVYKGEFGELVKDCTPEEIELLSKIIKQIKTYGKIKE
jgi:transcriptional regulator with XRE-family HTH domain